MEHGIMYPMKEATVQIDGAGRVVLPKPLRDRFRLRGGDLLAIEVRGDAIELRPTQATGELKRVNGVLVFTAHGPLASAGDLVAQSRDERIDDLMRDVKERR
jgi:AbrB family looped-hinge helix DNA binding protein